MRPRPECALRGFGHASDKCQAPLVLAPTACQTSMAEGAKTVSEEHPLRAITWMHLESTTKQVQRVTGCLLPSCRIDSAIFSVHPGDLGSDGKRGNLRRYCNCWGQHPACRHAVVIDSSKGFGVYEARCRRCKEVSPKCGIRLSQHAFMQSKSSSGLKVPKTQPLCNFGQAVVCHQDSAHTALVSMYL